MTVATRPAQAHNRGGRMAGGSGQPMRGVKKARMGVAPTERVTEDAD